MGAANEPCCDWVGNEGAGHYVKMVHNGIEYGDMQLICEAYSLMKVQCAEEVWVMFNIVVCQLIRGLFITKKLFIA